MSRHVAGTLAVQTLRNVFGADKADNLPFISSKPHNKQSKNNQSKLTFQWGSILVVSSWSPLSACSKIPHQFGHQGTARHLEEGRGGMVIKTLSYFVRMKRGSTGSTMGHYAEFLNSSHFATPLK